MGIERIVFGINHSNPKPEIAIENISLDIFSGDRVGLETSQNWIDKYSKIKKEYGTEAKSIANPLGELIYELYNFNQNDTEYTINHTFAFHYFFFKTFSSFQDLGIEVVGLGSDKRTKYIREYSANSDLRNEVIHFLLCYSHFDNHLIELVKETECNKVVVGTAHAMKITEFIDCQLRIIDGLPLGSEIEFKTLTNLDRIYKSGKYELPDIRD